MATEAELKEIIRTKRGGNWIEYQGPFQMGTANVWEIWTWTNENKEDKDDWTPQTRFWLEDENGVKHYFDYFGDLAAYLNKRKSTKIAPADEMTIAELWQLVTALKIGQFWMVLGALLTIVGRVFFAGAKLGHFFGL
jgi:hypothetical protein